MRVYYSTLQPLTCGKFKQKKNGGRRGSNRCSACPESSDLHLSQTKMVIICRLQEANFKKSSIAEFGCDARFFAEHREACCVGGIVARSRGLGGRC